jgi:hypothetical protein
MSHDPRRWSGGGRVRVLTRLPQGVDPAEMKGHEPSPSPWRIERPRFRELGLRIHFQALVLVKRTEGQGSARSASGRVQGTTTAPSL